MAEHPAETTHLPVLLEETLELLVPGDSKLVVDATIGLGGHTEAILTRWPKIQVIGIDQDREAIEIATRRLNRFGKRVKIIHSNFSDIKTVVSQLNVSAIDVILADLGASSMQLDSETRGFSFRFDAPLDMRMDPTSGEPTAADLLEELSEEDIADIIYRFGEERFSRRIARRVVERRKVGNPIRMTRELVELIEKTVRRSPKEKIHPATRTFQALRIAVNREIDILERFIYDAVDLLTAGGRLAMISFHSLEDRIVKHTFQKLSGKCSCPPRLPRCECGAVKLVEVLTKKPVTATEEEMKANPRSRSAKLRAVRKLA